MVSLLGYLLRLLVVVFFFLPLLANVATFLGLPPGFPAFLLRLTAERICDLVIRLALLAGPHLGYPPLPLPLADFLPHGA